MDFLVANASDFALAASLIAVFVLYGAFRSTGMLLSIALSMPIAGFLFVIFPYHTEIVSFMPAAFELWVPILLFGLFLLLTLWILQRTVGIASGSEHALHIVTTALALTAIIIAFLYHIVPLEEIHDFGSTFDMLFASTTNFFWIVILALLALFVV